MRQMLQLIVNSHPLRLEVRDGIQPTVFSLFLANMLKPDDGVKLAVDAGAGGGILSVILALGGVERVVAIERSAQACELIRANAMHNGVGDRIEIVCADIGDCASIRDADLVVSNPPTVPEQLGSPGFVAGSGSDGFAFLRALVEASGGWLRPGGVGQFVISSRVDEARFLDLCRDAGLVSRAISMMLAPVRGFYFSSYSAPELADFQAKGALLVEGHDGKGYLNEVLTFYECRRA